MECRRLDKDVFKKNFGPPSFKTKTIRTPSSILLLNKGLSSTSETRFMSVGTGGRGVFLGENHDTSDMFSTVYKSVKSL